VNNKNILIFLIILIVYINLFTPLSEKNKNLLQKIIATKQAIQKDRLYIQYSKRIKHELYESNITNTAYIKRYFYEEANTQIFSLMQKEIKNLISTSSVHEDLIKWGESYQSDKLIIFPINVRVSGSVKKLGSFFELLDNNYKINIKDFTMQRMKEHYFLKISVYGVKRN
jgi:Tfp pilus assembly protein PilO